MKTKLINGVIRNIVAYVIVTILIFTSITIFAVSADSEKTYGDIDASNSINASDALLVLQHAAKISSLDEKQKNLADVNVNKLINAEDALIILQYAAKIIDKFPIEEVETPDVIPTSSTDVKDFVSIKSINVSNEGELSLTLDNDTVLTLGNIKGRDGVGVAKIEINSDGKLVVSYTDDNVVTLDKVVGEDGIGIKKAELTDDDMLKLTFTDDSTQIVGPIRGEKGADGVGIKNISVGEDGYLYVTFDDSDVPQKIAYIKGDPGEDGKTPYIKNGNWWIGDTDTGIKAEGSDGADGKDGIDGVDGKTPYIKNGNWWIGDTDTGIKAEGSDGADGKDGIDGVDGVSVVNCYVDEKYHLWIVLSNGTKIDAGYVGVSTDSGTEPEVPTTHTVIFKDWDGTVLKTEAVESGKAATAPANPIRNGYTFVGWDQSFSSITSDLVVTAKYTQISSQTYTVTFIDYDGTTLATRVVNSGATTELPVNPGKVGSTFLGWSGNYANVTQNEIVTAVYSDTKNVFIVDSASGSVGDTVTVLVAVDGSVKTCGFDFNLFYDSALELVSYDNDLDLDIIINDSIYTNGIKLNFSSASDKTKQRDIIELKFRINDTTKTSLPIVIEMTEVFEVMDSGAIENASYEIINGIVTVK